MTGLHLPLIRLRSNEYSVSIWIWLMIPRSCSVSWPIRWSSHSLAHSDRRAGNSTPAASSPMSNPRWYRDSRGSQTHLNIRMKIRSSRIDLILMALYPFMCLCILYWSPLDCSRPSPTSSNRMSTPILWTASRGSPGTRYWGRTYNSCYRCGNRSSRVGGIRRTYRHSRGPAEPPRIKTGIIPPIQHHFVFC